MHIDERTVALRMAARPDVADVGWFAARQPGLLRYLEDRCGAGTDAFGVAVDAAWRLCETFAAALGVPPVRLDHRDLERAQRAVVVDAAGPDGAGLGDRQPELFRWLAGELARPSCPLGPGERARVGTALAAAIYALDAAATGRRLPGA